MTEVKKKLNEKEKYSCNRDNLLVWTLREVKIDVLSREEAEKVEQTPYTAFTDIFFTGITTINQQWII